MASQAQYAAAAQGQLGIAVLSQPHAHVINQRQQTLSQPSRGQQPLSHLTHWQEQSTQNQWADFGAAQFMHNTHAPLQSVRVPVENSENYLGAKATGAAAAHYCHGGTPLQNPFVTAPSITSGAGIPSAQARTNITRGTAVILSQESLFD